MSAHAQVSPTAVGDYVLEGIIGRGGGGGVVYRATHRARPEPVALKVIPGTDWDSPAGRRFREETRLAAAVSHRHILPVYETGAVADGLFVAMLLGRGGDLGSVIRREGLLSPERAVELVQQLAGALDAAHSHGLVHGDVKPGNVLLDELRGREHAYIADFGATRVAFADTRGEEALGTAGYSAPEQIRGEEVDGRTDVYALGCVLYECLTGRVPFARRDGLTTLWAHLNDDPPHATAVVSTLPAGIDAVLARALAKNREDRYPSARAFAAAAVATIRRPNTELTSAPLRIRSDRFLGREAELGATAQLLTSTRLVTVTGPGGAGKTRFALELARDRAETFPDGVATCFLASLRDPDLVVTSLCRSLGVRERPGQDPFEALVEHLAEQNVLIVLDNVEHLQESAEILPELLARAPGLVVLATSRERLGLPDEHVYVLPPLSREESIELFCDRSGAEPTRRVDDICKRLDGLPLAIELAAARIDPTLGGADRLTDRLDLLAPSTDVDPRQDTLRATIQWSYELLAPDRRAAFARLSVFAGGCTAESAFEVADVGADALDELLAKSLVRVEGDRYTMLETIREFASDQLGADERDALRTRHASILADRLYDSRVNISRRDSQARKLLEAELANIESAFEHALAEASAETALKLWVGGSYFWLIHGRLSEGDHWGRRAVELSAPPTELYGKALGLAGEFPRFMGDLERALDVKERAIAVLEQLQDDPEARRSLAASATDLADVLFRLGRPEEADAYAQRALALRTELGEAGGIAHALTATAQLASRRGRHDDALTTWERIEALWLEAERPENAVVARLSIGYERRALGDAEGARQTLEAAQAELPATAQGELAWTSAALGLVALDEHRFEDAARLLAEGRERARLADWVLDIDGEVDHGLARCREQLEPARYENACAAGVAAAT